MPTRLVVLARLFYLALLLAAALVVVGLLTRTKPAKPIVALRHQPQARLHFASLQPHSRIHKSAARRPKRVLVVKPTVNDQL